MLTRRSSRSTIILSLRKSPARAAGAQEESPPSTADVRLHKRRILNILYLSKRGKLHICYKMCPSFGAFDYNNYQHNYQHISIYPLHISRQTLYLFCFLLFFTIVVLIKSHIHTLYFTHIHRSSMLCDV